MFVSAHKIDCKFSSIEGHVSLSIGDDVDNNCTINHLTGIAREFQMGMISRKTLHLENTQQVENIHPGENASRISYHPANEGNLAQLNAEDSPRIKALKEDLSYFRGMLEQMVQQKTEKVDRRDAILNSCNTLLGTNYHKMHNKYLELLNKTQADEAEMHLRVLEGELARLMKHRSAEAGVRVNSDA